MCGIFTAINNDKENLEIMQFLSVVEHRGPDDFGWVNWDSGKAIFSKEDEIISGELVQGHVRLSIIDLSTLGWQPMQSACGRYSICYNGEVYNYIEIRNELVEAGIQFTSSSDTEVILYAIIFWGESAISRFRGMFSFTFYDSLDRELLVARDQFGIKPLYYAQAGNNIYIASEISQLLLCSGVSREHDAQMIYEYMISGAADHTSSTMYKDVKQFPAAHYARISIGGAVEVKPCLYWTLDLEKKIRPTFDEATAKVRELFLESISLHMRSDVEIGSALSGGIDSSAIVCAMRHLCPHQEIHTISFIAENKAISEEKWIDVVNEFVGAKVHKITVSKEELIADLNDLMRTQGEPFGSTSIYAQYRVFKEAKKSGITVMLDGQGADEMLAGYIFYQASFLAGLIRCGNFVSAYNFCRACVTNTSSTAKYLALTTVRELLPISLVSKIEAFLLPRKRGSWISDKWLLAAGGSDKRRFKRIVNWDYPLKAHLKSTLTELGLPNLLRYEDRDSMRWSVESRVPFLYVELVEYLYSLPDEYLLNERGVSKYVFREAMRGIVPDVILDRKDKIGFQTPEQDWLLELDGWVTDRLIKSEQLPMFNTSELKKEWIRVVSNKAVFDFRCWRWLNLISWMSKDDAK